MFGRIVTGETVRAAAEATIRDWLDTYLAEMSRQTGLTIPPARSYSTGVAPGFPVEELPAIVIVGTGTSGTPERRGDGTVGVEFELGVGAVVADPHRDTAHALAWAYEGALRALMAQQKSLGGVASTTTWLYSDVTETAWSTDRSVHAAALIFAVKVENALSVRGAPTTPPPAPAVPSTTVTVTSTHVTPVHTP